MFDYLEVHNEYSIKRERKDKTWHSGSRVRYRWKMVQALRGENQLWEVFVQKTQEAAARQSPSRNPEPDRKWANDQLYPARSPAPYPILVSFYPSYFFYNKIIKRQNILNWNLFLIGIQRARIFLGSETLYHSK